MLYYIDFLNVIFYIAVFSILGMILAKSHLKRNPLEENESERIKIILHHYEKQEEISFILCGFAIISLVFIITQFQAPLGEAEIVVGLFSLAFVCEILAAFLYHHMQSNYYGFLGMVFQYGGLFSILLGFSSYLSDLMEWSLMLNLIFIFGWIVFIILSGKELQIIINYSRDLDRSD